MKKSLSSVTPIYGKDLIMEIESNVDEMVMWEFVNNYKTLMKQFSNVKDGFNTTSHNLLMDYLFFYMNEQDQEVAKDRLGV
tara:strand:+ start:5695 stop:5937 length:243 start_codon:yes stop_codon:yes gene_type:complete